MAYQLGIVLSGGGTRGIAHIGVLQALTEHGLTVDCLAGSSSGAIVGAFYAAGCSAEQMLEFFIARSPFKFSMLSAMRKAGIFDSGKVRADLLEYLPDDSFAALDKKLFIAATDIVNGRPAIFDSGPLISPILASASMPMVFTPIEIEGRLYLDGGILNNFPVEPLQGICDVIVGVYATPLQVTDQGHLTNALAVTQRALEVGIYHASRAKFHTCDVMILPSGLGAYGAFDTKHVREIYEAGYHAARDHLGAIEKRLADVV